MIKYISPTSFIKYQNCPYQVYLLKVKQVLGEGTDFQSLAMATGTATDIMIKSHLNRRINREELLAKEIKPENKGALLVAEQLFDCYQRHAIPNLRAEGIGYGSVDQESELTWTQPCSNCSQFITDNKSNGSTIKCNNCKEYKSWCRGMPDLTLTDGTVIDWKCQGMFSSKGKIPEDGYVRCYVYGNTSAWNGRDMGPSGKYDCPFHTINRNWAIQLYLYARILGHTPGKPLRAGIENITVGPDNTVYVASYRNPIVTEFQLEIEKAFHEAYAMLTGDPALVPLPMYNGYRCKQYNKLCEVAEHCSSYRELVLGENKPMQQGGLTLLEGL